MKQKSSQMRFAPWPVVQAALALALSGLLLARPQAAAQGFAAGLKLCGGSLLTALFPLFVVCGLLGPLAPALGWPLRPLMRLCGIRSPRAPAVLVEIGYHDNEADARWIESHIDAIGQNLAMSMAEYFGLPFTYPGPSQPGVIVTESGGPVNLRAEPSVTGRVLTRIPSGETVTVFGQYRGWYVVLYGDTLGYVSAPYVQI